MDDKIPVDERAINALKRAVTHDLTIVTQLDYQYTPAKHRRFARLILAAGITVFLGILTFMSGRMLFPAQETLVSDYDAEVRMLIDEIHIDNPSRFELADLE